MGLMLSTLNVPLPKTGIVLGGTIELHGTNISLACFHGINFKVIYYLICAICTFSEYFNVICNNLFIYFIIFFGKKAKSWALFSLRDPCINFATEAKRIDNTNDVIVIQTLTFGLGIANNSNQTHSLATVCRMTRNIIFPPQFKTLQEWFNYAFSSSEIDGMSCFVIFISALNYEFQYVFENFLTFTLNFLLQLLNASQCLNVKKNKIRIRLSEADLTRVKNTIIIVK